MATIRKRGDKWQVQVRRQGHAPLSRSFYDLKDARTWARQSEVQADRGDLPPDPKALEKITLGELVARYRDTVAIHHKRREIDRIVLNAFLRHPICRKRLSEVTGEAFAAYRDERLEEIKPVTLKRDLGLFHNVFEVARRDWGLPLKANPVSLLRFTATDHRRERRFRPGEWERLLVAAKERRNPYIVPIIVLAVETGMRRGEILGMRWDDVGVETQTLAIPQTKTGQFRRIPLTLSAMAALVGVKRTGPKVFPITPNAFRLTWERLKALAGLEDLHFHDLRHEAISRLFESGLTVPEVALVSGHRDVRMLFRYAHAQLETVAKKLRKLPDSNSAEDRSHP